MNVTAECINSGAVDYGYFPVRTLNICSIFPVFDYDINYSEYNKIMEILNENNSDIA